MKISAVNNNIKIQSFKGATVNINAFSDTHGELILANNALEEMRSRKEDIFCKEGKGKTNVLAICGDWFMDGGKTGYTAEPNKPLAEFQLKVLNTFIKQINKLAPHSANLFLPGNHEFDGGVSLLAKILAKINADVIATNIDFKHSPEFNDIIQGNKLVKEKIITVDDDKDPDKTHKVMFLGVIPVNLVKYQKNTNGITPIDNIKKSQAEVERADYSKTIDYCKDKISQFKEENPDGIVVFMSHTGVEFADNLAKESTVDLIFDGHEHKDEIRVVNDTPIIPLSQNFKKIVNTKLKINDNGKLDNIQITDIKPAQNHKQGILSKLYLRLFKEDLKKLYSIQTEKPNIEALDIDGIREGNNYLANFITDSILEEAKKKDPTINFFALNASAMRHPLNVSEEPQISPLDIMNVLAGITEVDGSLMITEVTGKELSYMVADNYLFSKETPDKNPVIHYSGLITKREQIWEALENGVDPYELTEYIIDAETNMPIEPDKTYKIMNVEKYFNKSKNSVIKDLKAKSEFTGNKVQELFKNHFTKSNGKLTAKCDKRII